MPGLGHQQMLAALDAVWPRVIQHARSLHVQINTGHSRCMPSRRRIALLAVLSAALLLAGVEPPYGAGDWAR